DPTNKPMFGANLAKDITNRELKQARNILGVIGVITIAVQAVTLNDVHHQVAMLNTAGAAYDHALVDKLEMIAYVGLGVGVAYLLGAFPVGPSPVVATVTGLTLSAGNLVAQAVVDPSALLPVFGIGPRTPIVIALVPAVNFARVYEKNRRAESIKPMPAA